MNYNFACTLAQIQAAAIVAVLLQCSVSSSPQQAHFLPDLPSSARSWSHYLHKTRDSSELVDIEEFIDLRRGSLRLELNELRSSHFGQGNELTSYFRLGEKNDDDNNNEQGDEYLFSNDDTLIEHKLKDEICTAETTSEWPLRGLSQFLDQVNLLERFNKTGGWRQRLEIGPSGLVRFVYNNANLFKLDSKSFNYMSLVDSYYFSTDLLEMSAVVAGNAAGSGTVDKVKIVVVLPTRNVASARADANDERVKVGETLLSQVETREHISMLGIFTAKTEDIALSLGEARGFELFELPSGALMLIDRVMLIIDMIVDSSAPSFRHHLGLMREVSVASNPFTLPPAAGCGLLLPNTELLYVEARQFSGRFKALGFSDQYFVAYDGLTDHLRLDTLGEFKLVYSQSEKLATMISTQEEQWNSNGNDGQESQALRPSVSIVDDLDHCVQYNLQDFFNKQKNALFEARTLAQLLGLGPMAGCAYLGTQFLEDDQLLCHVYEREVTHEQIPALLLVHARHTMRASDRYFLSFHFALNTESVEAEVARHNYKRMWLKRVRLTSYNDRSLSLIQAELTFDEFSWSLEVEAEEDVENDGRDENRAHPVRVFDTLECSGQQAQSKVQLKLEQLSEREREGDGWRLSENSTNRVAQFRAQLNLVEDKLMQTLVQRAQVPRAKLNQLEVEAHEGADDLLVSFVLSKPMNFEHTIDLVGWILQVESVTGTLSDDENNNSKGLPAGELLKYRTSMSLEECTLRVASHVQQQQAQLIHVLHCPRIGCGYVRTFKWAQVERDLLITRRGHDAPSLESYARMCSVHAMTKRLSASQVVSYASTSKLGDNLDGPVRLPLFFEKQATTNNGSSPPVVELQPFVGLIKDVTISKNLNHEQWDEQVAKGKCYTIKTKLVPAHVKQHGSDAAKKFAVFNEQTLRIVQLDFDKHHTIRQCHLACLMYPFCRTYTYSASTHQCTLANLEASLIAQLGDSIQLEGTLDDASCSLLALNQMVRFKQSMVSIALEPVRLLSQRVPLLVVDLETCASLCHRNQFNLAQQENPNSMQRQNACVAFIYMRSHSLCRLLDTQDNPWYALRAETSSATINATETQSKQFHVNYSELLEALGQPQDSPHGIIRDQAELEHYMGQEVASKVRHCEMFEPDYKEHLFSVRKNTVLMVDQPKGEYTIQSIDLAPLVRFSDSATLEECLRKCALYDQDCLALDYYIDTNSHARQYPAGVAYERVCILYYFRSPFSIDSQLFETKVGSAIRGMKLAESIVSNEATQIDGLALSDWEKKFYSYKYAEHKIHTNVRAGWHFYMTGDQLYLRRSIARAATNRLEEEISEEVAKLEKQQQQQLPQRQEQTPVSFDYIGEHHLNVQRSSSFIMVLGKLFFGAIGGFMVFNYINQSISGSQMTSSMVAIQLFRDMSSLAHSSWLKLTGSRERSMSRAELNEMVDVHGY